MTAPGRAERAPRAVVPALGIVQIFAWGCSYYLPAVLAGPIAADTGWSMAGILGGLSAGLFVAAMVSPRVGEAILRHGGRPVLAVSSLLLAGGLLAMAAAPNLAVFLAAWIVVGAGMGAGLYDAAFSTLGGLYGQRARPAIGALTLWGGFSSTLCWPLSAFLVAHLGWRGACAGHAAIQIGLCLPLLLLVLPRGRGVAAAVRGPLPAARPAGGERKGFRILAWIMILTGLVTTIISVQLMVLLEGQGVGLAQAVGMGALMGPAQVAARLIEMAGRGRHPAMVTMIAALALIAAGLGLLAWGRPLTAAAVALYGAGNGVFSIARGAVPLALFGPEGYARLMGQLARPSLIAQAVAPILGAGLLDAGGVDATLAVLVLLALAALALGIALWRAGRG